jgi:hypothetical protein
LHSKDVGRAISEGLLHLYGLDEPFKLDGLVLPLDHLRPSDSNEFRTLCRLQRTLHAISDHVRGEVFLPDVLQHLALGDHDPAEVVDALLESIDLRDAFGASSGASVRVAVPIVGDLASSKRLLSLTTALLKKCADRRDLAPGLSLVFTAGNGPLPASWSEDEMEALSRHGGTEVLLERSQKEPMQRNPPRRLRAGLGRVAINLPQALLGFDGNGGIQAALECIRPAAAAAASALHERYWGQRSGGREGLHGLVVHLGGPGEVEVAVADQWGDVEIWGLGHALDLLIARRATSPTKRCEAAARLLGFIDYILGEDRAGVRFQVRLGATQDRSVRRHFLSSLEAQAKQIGAAELKTLLARGDGDSALPLVLPLLSHRNRPLLQASFAERLGRGLMLSLSAFEESAFLPLLSRMAKETRLRLFSLSPERRGADLFEVQEELFPDFEGRG